MLLRMPCITQRFRVQRSSQALKRLHRTPQNANQKKKQNMYTPRNANKHIDIINCHACRGVGRYHCRCHSRSSLKHKFVSCCCNRLQSNENHNFLGFLTLPDKAPTSSCTQRPPRPDFYEAKCSCIFAAFCHCLDVFLF